MFDEYQRIIKVVMKRGCDFVAIVGRGRWWSSESSSESDRVGVSQSEL